MILALALAAAQAAEPANWFIIQAQDGATIGRSSQRIVATPDGREIQDERELRLQEQDLPVSRIVERTTIRQDAAGRTLSILEYWQNGASWTRTEARIVGDRAEIIRQTNVSRSSVTIVLPEGVRFDSGGGLLATWDPGRTPRLEFDNFNLGAMAVERVVIALAPGAASDAEGGLTLLRTRYDGGELRSVARLRLDQDRRVVEILQPMLGTSTTIRPTDRETALRPYPPFRAIPRAMMRSPYRIASAAAAGHIRYRFSFQDGLVFAFPQTDEQRATANGAETVIDICGDCGPGLPSDPATLADALRPTAWLQSDHIELRAIAAPIGRQNLTGRRKMELLIERARPYFHDLDFSGHYSALDMMRRRAGDCTEAAVLVAALARAAGIPARVANGLVYSRERYHGVSNAFMPHSWVIAYVDGRWRSFDLALDAFDATHIALTVGDGDARSVQAAIQLAGLLGWEEMREVRAR